MDWVERDGLVHNVLACGVADNISLSFFVGWANVPGCNHVFLWGYLPQPVIFAPRIRRRLHNSRSLYECNSS